jgi:hypothetical protein
MLWFVQDWGYETDNILSLFGVYLYTNLLTGFQENFIALCVFYVFD